MADEATETDDLPKAEETTEFEDAFAEFAGKPTDETSDESPGDAESTTGTTAEGKADETSVESGTDDGAGAATDKAAGDEDPFKGWPQEAIDRYKSQLTQTEQLQHRLDSDSGRVRAFQLKVNELEKTVTDIQAAGKGDQPTKEEINEAMAGDDAEWAAFAEDYPEVAGAIDKRFEAQQNAINTKIDSSLAPVIEQQQHDSEAAAETAATKNYSKVAETFPTWQTEVQKQEYHDWYATQSPGVQGLGGSDDPQDASMLLGLYDDYRVANGTPSMKSKPDPESDDNTGVTTKADELAERRRIQLEDGTTLPSKSARVNPDAEAPDEFETAFNAFAARKEAKNRR